MFKIWGKTTIMKMFINRLKDGGLPDGAVFYFDLEDLGMLDLCNKGVDSLIGYIDARTSYVGKIYIFIDEIQYLASAPSFIKLMVDDHSDRFKLFISGSSALGVKSKIRKSLVGRVVTFEVFGLDFEEFPAAIMGGKYFVTTVSIDLIFTSYYKP